MATEIPRTFPMTIYDMVNIVLGRTIDRQIHAILRFNGRIDEVRLGKALRLAMDAEPVLGCRVVEHPMRPYWERREDLDAICGCGVVETKNEQAEIEKFVTEIADPRVDPLIIIKIFRDVFDTVAIKINHIAGDGAGAKDFLYLLADAYRKLGEIPDYTPTANINGDRSLRQVLQGVGLMGKLRLLRNMPHVEPVTVFPYRKPDRKTPALALRHLEPEAFTKLKGFGREHYATVNDLLLTAFYRTIFQMIPHDPDVMLPVNVPLDLRSFTKRKKAGGICNLVGTYYPAVLPSACTDFISTLLFVQKEMRKWKANGPRLGIAPLADIGLLKVPLKAIRGHMESGYDRAEQSGKMLQALTNIGILDQERLSFGESAVAGAYMVSPLFYPPNFILGASTFGECLTLTSVYCCEEDGGSAVEEFLDQMVAELTSVV